MLIPMPSFKRRYPIGAELISPDQTHFRVWAPKARKVDVVIEAGGNSRPCCPALAREPSGYFAGAVNVGAGTRYRFRIDDGENFYPDPASRFQPHGPHGASCIVDPTKFRWTDAQWPGITLKGQIIYEMHIGTFTKKGTWRAATEQLLELARIGITVIEMMPVAEFAGKFGWGYDGVDLFAPSHLYGTPDDLRAFIDRAHSLGLGVILDVVYNHFGPDGNYLGAFSDDYLVHERQSEWGSAINFDGPNAGPVREFFITNGRYWIEEFHFDGFRFDALHAIRDQSSEYIIAAVGRAARETARRRSILLIAENDLQEAKMVRPPSKGGDNLDAMWNDDFHHSAVVALTSRKEAYFADYRGAPQEFISAAKYGFLYQGQVRSWRKALRGTPALDIALEAFVCFIENHDQIANIGSGQRLRFQTSPGCYRALTALLLLGPWTPLLFQGQEFGASSPFLFFADAGDASVHAATRKGRAKLLAPFLSVTEAEALQRLPLPDAPETFARCKLDFGERKKNRQLYDLHIDLLKLRREDAHLGGSPKVSGALSGSLPDRIARSTALSLEATRQRRRQHAEASSQSFRRAFQQDPGAIDGAVLGPASFVLRYFSRSNDDRLLLVNLGHDQSLQPASEPLLAPPLGCKWELLWTSDSPRYGGKGPAAAGPTATPEPWTLPAECTVILKPAFRP
jgi:maltooligosyltrehalose trehalohydrolase